MGDTVMERKGETQVANGVTTTGSLIKPQARKLHDSAVSFEEYHWYALRTREEERSLPAPRIDWREILLRKKPTRDIAERDANGSNGPSDPGKQQVPTAKLVDSHQRADITDEEWTNASRAFRTASRGACFYLITTDILGPYVSNFQTRGCACADSSSQGVGFVCFAATSSVWECGMMLIFDRQWERLAGAPA